MGAAFTSSPAYVAQRNMGKVSLLLVLFSIAAVPSGQLLTGSTVRSLTRSHVA